MKKTFLFYISIAYCGLTGCEDPLKLPFAEQRPVLRAPANNLATTDTTHIFYWDVVEGATRYQLQVVSPAFDSIARLGVDTTIARNQFKISLSKNSYAWRVRALSAGTSSEYSDTFYLKIE